MKHYVLTSLMVAAAVSLATAADSDKSLTQKTGDTLSKAGEKTKDAARSVVDGTKKAGDALVDAVTPDADAKKVEVKLAEKHLALPSKIEAGKIAFVVHNDGKEDHSFAVTGKDFDKRFVLPVTPGKEKVLHADLKPGTYTAFCPEKGAEHEGMKATFTVK